MPRGKKQTAVTTKHDQRRFGLRRIDIPTDFQTTQLPKDKSMNRTEFLVLLPIKSSLKNVSTKWYVFLAVFVVQTLALLVYNKKTIKTESTKKNPVKTTTKTNKNQPYKNTKHKIDNAKISSKKYQRNWTKTKSTIFLRKKKLVSNRN